MKKNIKSFIHNLKYAILLGAIISNTACDNRIDLEPTQLITNDVALITLSDYNTALNGVYVALRFPYLTYVSSTDRTGDDVKFGFNSLGQGAFLYNQNASSGEGAFATIWDGFYSAINRSNNIITKLPDLKTVTAAEEAEKNRILGEAIAIRAMAHFDLLRVFANRIQGNGGSLGVPYVTSVLKPAAKPTRNTIQEVMDNVLVDLNQAESLLPNNLPPARATLSRVAVKALKARYFLYKGEFANALAAADDAITASGLSLSTGAEYRGIWNDTQVGEVILKIKFIQSQGSLGGEYYGEQLDTHFFTPTVDITSIYSTASDTRYAIFFGQSPTNVSTIYKHRGPGTTPSGDFGRVDVKWLRVSELFLIRAEASLETGNEVAARTALHDIRTARITGYDRASITDPEVLALNAATGNVLRELIRTERRKELCFEGHRFLDLKRQNLSMVRIDCNASPASACTLTPGAARFTYAIPQGEMAANTNMVQNPGY